MPEGKQTVAQRLADPDTLEAFCADVFATGSVAAAARKHGLDQWQVHRLSRKPGELHDALWAALQAAAEDRWHRCNAIAENATPESVQVDRFRVDTFMRVAGKLMQAVYGEQATQTTQIVNNVGIVCDEATRGRLIAMREKMLLGGRGPTTPALPDTEPEAE